IHKLPADYPICSPIAKVVSPLKATRNAKRRHERELQLLSRSARGPQGSIVESSDEVALSFETNSPANFSLLARAELVLALSAATTRPRRLKTGTEMLTRPSSNS